MLKVETSWPGASIWSVDGECAEERGGRGESTRKKPGGEANKRSVARLSVVVVATPSDRQCPLPGIIRTTSDRQNPARRSRSSISSIAATRSALSLPVRIDPLGASAMNQALIVRRHVLRIPIVLNDWSGEHC